MANFNNRLIIDSNAFLIDTNLFPKTLKTASSTDLLINKFI